MTGEPSNDDHPLRHVVDTLDRLDPHDLRMLRQAAPSPAGLITSPETIPRVLRVTVIGDIRIDIRAAITGQRFIGLDTDCQVAGPVVTDVGGTAINFARAALAHFADVRIIGALGDDSWTEFIRSRCTGLDPHAYLQVVAQPNSSVIVLRDEGTSDNPDGIRLLMADDHSPYGWLDPEQVRAGGQLIQSSDALAIDGYGLLQRSSAEALDVAVDLAVDAGVPVCFDIVPHRIDQRLPFDALAPFIHRSSLVTVEAHTLLRLLGRPVPDVIRPEDAQALIDGLPDDLAGWQRTWLVRFGYGNMDETMAISHNHHSVYYRTGYAEAESTASYGSLVTAAELKWWLTNFAWATGVYPNLATRRRTCGAHRGAWAAEALPNLATGRRTGGAHRGEAVPS